MTSSSDQRRGRGVAASVSVWSDPSVDWSATPLCLLRSTWDYHGRYAEFMAWVDRVTAVTVVRNDPALVRWSAHKSYLRDLAERGVPVVPTRWLRQGEKHALDDETHEIMTLWWYRIVPHRSYVKGWKISPSHFVNQDLATIWLDK